MWTPRFFRKKVFQVFLAAVAGAALVAGLDLIPGFAASEKQLWASPFIRAARSAERVEAWGLNRNGDALEHTIEMYMWKDVYMMGEVVQIIEIPHDGGDDYLLHVFTGRNSHQTHDANVWTDGHIALIYWDVPSQFSISEDDIVEFVATVEGFYTYTSTSEHIITVPRLRVVEFQEMAFPGTVEDAG
ncbi:MAG: hypothetical protein F4047_07630 [Caldilineaceae bacterium SB0670_bin_27]|uniref:Uncharacterized protein n=1 Tax=Caldilineaceae bacterium SB0664_bin_27 TaxID=2605260 RepID=A0A6B0YX12_9CHLR|nr:hypothetical protein [Caldilineaceae bacterium SB0664_bin_27]MYJ78006.1 hypothetical protein [Caldilineaceae bacterium SB0670_bin_27]